MNKRKPSSSITPTNKPIPVITDVALPKLTRLELFVENLRDKVRNLDETLDNWAGKFMDDPFNAMSWSQSTFEAAARHQVFKGVLTALTEPDGKATLESIQAHAERQIHTMARYPQYSSSAASNFANLQLLSAWAELVEMFNWFPKEV